MPFIFYFAISLYTHMSQVLTAYLNFSNGTFNFAFLFIYYYKECKLLNIPVKLNFTMQLSSVWHILLLLFSCGLYPSQNFIFLIMTKILSFI